MANLPHGALELLIALQTPSPKGHRGIPVLVWGQPGVGKSSFIEQLARPDYPVVTITRECILQRWVQRFPDIRTVLHPLSHYYEGLSRLLE
jgi:predicted AAA+ superfamily ATPase